MQRETEEQQPGFKIVNISFLPVCCPGLVILLGICGGSDGKESTCNPGELGLIPG